MQERLADRVPPGTLEDFDGSMDAEHRVSLTKPYRPKTIKNYTSRLRHYQRWCAEKGYQPDPQFITDASAEQYVAFQCRVERFAPTTIQQSLSALRYYAERAGVQPMPAFLEAHGLLRFYVIALEEAGLVRAVRHRSAASTGRGVE
jgi:hypothetical protein